jgi:coenzyme F420-0:L-glutamate ligase / coenzyme F420-1:gamma-L-glutamate ligase
MPISSKTPVNTNENPVSCYLVAGMPVINEGDDLAALIDSLFELQDGDVICVASTVAAKSEGMFRNLEDYQPSQRAAHIAEAVGKDPRFVQAVLDESEEVLLEKPFILSVTKFGHIGVNAGIDQSNVGGGKILLLPQRPQASAQKIRSKLSKDCAVIITDTCGRAFRCGVTGVAIGWSGIAALRDWRGERDIHGKRLEITQEATIDEIAGMANLLMGEAGDGMPVAVIRGLRYSRSGGQLFMPEEKDVIRSRLKS